MHRSLPSLCSILFTIAVFPLQARGGGKGDSLTAPDTAAGIIEKQLQQEFSLDKLPPDRSVPVLEIDIPENRLRLPQGIMTRINTVILEGNTVLPESAITDAFSEYIGRDLTGCDVQELCRLLECFYAKRGYIAARVYPPVQTIENQTLVLRALEGTLQNVRIEGNRYYKTSYLEKFFRNITGKPLNYNTLMRALLLINANMDCEAEGVLQKGSGIGEIDLIVRIQDDYPAHMNLGYNNWGSQYTSYNQMTSEIDIGNLATSGDLLTLMTAAAVPPVMYYLNPVYSIPFGGSGLRLNLSYLFTHSSIQEEPKTKPSCWSEVGTALVVYPFLRSLTSDLDFSLDFSVKQYKNFVAEQTVSYDKLRVLSLGTQWSYLDFFRGRNFGFCFIRGAIPYLFNGSAPIDPESSRAGAGGRFFLCNLGYQRVQTLPWDTTLLITSSAQGTFNKLPLSEQFTIGGVGTVRGYRSAVASGDNGYCINTEWYLPIPGLKNKKFRGNTLWKNTLQLLAFLDHGAVYNNDAVYSELSPAYLTGAGVGLRFYGPKNVNFSFDAAFPLTNTYKEFNSFLYVRVIVNLF